MKKIILYAALAITTFSSCKVNPEKWKGHKNKDTYSFCKGKK